MGNVLEAGYHDALPAWFCGNPAFLNLEPSSTVAWQLIEGPVHRTGTLTTNTDRYTTAHIRPTLYTKRNPTQLFPNYENAKAVATGTYNETK